MPDCKILFLVYLNDSSLLEKMIKAKYEKQLVQLNHEYMIDTDITSLISSIKGMINFLNFEVTYEKDLNKYNNPYEEGEENNTENVMNILAPNIDEIVSAEVKEKVEIDPLEYIERLTKRPKKPEGELFKCEDCGKVYKQSSGLYRHKSDVHGNTNLIRLTEEQKNDVVCEECGKEFKDKYKKQRHIDNVHTKSTICKCEICDKELSSKDVLIHHIKDLHVERYVSCDICEEEFKNLGNLNKHIEMVHQDIDKNYICNHVDCSSVFKHIRYLVRHIEETHCTTKEVCKICTKEYKNKPNLRKHMKNVHKE